MSLVERVQFIADKVVKNFLDHLEAKGDTPLGVCEINCSKLFLDGISGADRKAIELLNTAMRDKGYTVGEPVNSPIVRTGSHYAFIELVRPGDERQRRVIFGGAPWVTDLVPGEEPQLRMYASAPTKLKSDFSDIVKRAIQKARDIQRPQDGQRGLS